ncbi:IPT/TIG domain-containing protein [Paenibacillus chitinolyticus]|uniref:IPT/TIG domain-containing protein n=1 Tax=Paenibacillus chitinolyticus TaxID=79263 RepID=UPI0036595388
MRKRPKLIQYFLLFILIFSPFLNFFGAQYARAAGETVTVTKSLSPTDLLEGGETEVTLNVQGSPDVNVVKPNDIILIIDRSGSMAPTYAPNKGEDKMQNAKDAAKGFIDLVDFTKHRVGIVDFASDVSFKNLSANPDDLKSYITNIKANGGTGTKSAIAKAQELLRNHRPDANPVILLMTDGEATEPAPADNARKVALEQANSAKAEGVVFYTIALLLPTDNPDTSGPNLLMKDMATTAHHHHFVLGSVGLAQIYAAIVDEIGVASAYDVSVSDIVGPEFEIVPNSYKDNIPQPTVTGNKLTWNFLELKKELLTFKYKIRHKAGAKVGSLPVGDKDISVQYKDYLGASYQHSVKQPNVNVKHYAPIITSVEKKVGMVEGGERVTITGQFFRTNATVTFGTKQAASVEFVNATTLVATTPAGSQGDVELRVTNDDGQFATSTYRYIANPIIESLTPPKGPLAGNTKVTIKGKNFLSGALVSFGDQQTVVTSVTPTEITVNTPASTLAQTVDVKVVNPDTTEVTYKSGFTYVEGPVLTSVTPEKGYLAGGDAVTLSGKHFAANAKVYFNNTLVNTTVTSDSVINLITPAWGAAGKVTVKVVNDDGQEALINQGFEYINNRPTITSVSPNSGEVTGGQVVDIKGTDFSNGAQVFFNSTKLSNVTFFSPTQLRIKTPQWPKDESVTVKVVNTDGQEAVLANGYSYLLPTAPEITSLSPISGPLAGGTKVTITGTHLTPGSELYVGSKKNAIQSLSDTQLVFITPAAVSAGKVDIKVVDSYGRETSLLQAFEYLAPPPAPKPTIISLTPNEGALEGGYNAILKGTNFEAGSLVYINNVNVAAQFYSSTELRFKIPASKVSGKVDVKVVNSSGEQFIAPEAFNYLAPPSKAAPVIATITPNEGALAGGYIVVIKGTDFDGNAQVYFGGTKVNSTFYSSSEIRVNVPASQTSGKTSVKIINSDGQEHLLADAFTYLAPPPPPGPTITSVTPNEGYLAGGYNLIVKGSNFTATTKVYMDNQQVSTVFYTNSEVRGKVPASDVEKTVDIKVVNDDSQSTTLAGAFKYISPPPPPAPTISNVAPSSGVISGGYYIYVNGTNFNTTSKVYINGQASGTTFYSSEQLRVLIPATNTAGSVNVRVLNGDGQEATLVNGFTYILPPPPTITELSPNSGDIAGGNTVAVKGTNFTSTSTVYVNQVAVPTTFYSNVELRIKMPKGNATVAVDIRVLNGDGQEVTLPNGYTYLPPVLAPAPTIATITPNQGYKEGGYYISIKGTNFEANSKVWINNTEVQTVFYSNTEVRGRVPSTSNLGAVNVKVINKDAQFAEIEGGFTYIAPPLKPTPTITSVTPNTGPLAGGSYISIKGTNFESTTKVYINNINVQTIFYSAGEIRAKAPASSAPGYVDIKVVTSDGQIVTLPGGYTYQ